MFPKPTKTRRKYSHIRAIGKKGAEWVKARKELKAEFYEMGITTCEIKDKNCVRSNMLSFAHIDKRRYLEAGEIKAVVLACISCHNTVERLPRLQMREILIAIISNRNDNTHKTSISKPPIRT